MVDNETRRGFQPSTAIVLRRLRVQDEPESETMTEYLEQTEMIIRQGMEKYTPSAIVAAISGGTDSLATYYAAKELGIPITHIVHVHTGTGIPETLDFVREWAAGEEAEYIERSAGDTFEQRVLRRGFYGRGERAHTFAYHELKASALRKAVSSIRQRRKNFKVLMLNGVRLEESDNRKYAHANSTYKADPAAKSNVWANAIEHWKKREVMDYLRQVNAPINPVANKLHRSGECMCGTMQSEDERQEAAFWYPGWGNWLDTLEAEVVKRFPWKWGEHTDKAWARARRGEQILPGMEDFFPLCQTCVHR